MNCDNIADYRVKITYKGTAEASGVIVKLDEFPNNFFVFTAKHTFDDDIEKDEVSILYNDNKIDFKSYIALSLDIVIFIFDNSALENIQNIEKVNISLSEKDFKDAVFSGYPNNVDGAYCEKCEYHEKITTEENLYRISPKQNTDSYFAKGLENSKGYSGSGLFITNENSYELVGIIKEHESSKSAFHYIALAPLKEEISTELTNSLYNKISLPPHLIDEIKNNNVVLFVGNEFSSSVGNFASTRDFIFDILDSVEGGEAFKALFKIDKMKSHKILDSLKDDDIKIIKDKIVELYSGVSINSFIKTLWSVTSKNIVTVNYDNLLESDIKNIEIISTDNNYKISKNSTHNKLFKLHGRVEDIDNILIFEDDYKKFYENKEIIKGIKNTFKDKTCLFIGFSTDEVYFDLMYDAIACKKKNYIISTSQKDFSKYEFEAIFIENYHQLNKVFNEVLKEEIVVAKEIIENIKVDEVQKEEIVRPRVCIYTTSPLNSDSDYNEKAGHIINLFNKLSVEIYHKILNEDNLWDSYGEYNYNFIFTSRNRDKIVIEDELFMQKSIDLDELETMVESSNTILFLNENIEKSQFKIYTIKNIKEIKKVFVPFLHKCKYFERGTSKVHTDYTELPELIDRKNLNNFVGRVTEY